MGRGHYRGKAVRDYENQKLWEKFLTEFNASLEKRAKRLEEKTAQAENAVAVEVEKVEGSAKEKIFEKFKNLWRILYEFLHIFKQK